MMAVVLISIGQILQKLAAKEIVFGDGLQTIIASLIMSPRFWQATAAMAIGLMVWLLALAEVEVSTAYPILGLSFALTTVLSVLFLGERVGRSRWVGVCLISAGAVLMVASQ